MNKWTAPVLLGIGFGAGFLVRGGGDGKVTVKESHEGPRETRAAIRSPRSDPFGGSAFSLSSMEDVRNLYRKQGSSVAMARLTLATSDLKADQIPDLMEMVRLDAREHPGEYDEGRYGLMGLLFERWAQVDPAAAIAYADSCKQRSFQRIATSSCFAAIGRVDPGRALAELEKMPKGELRKAAGSAVVNALEDSDPSAALDLLVREMPHEDFSTYYVASIMAKWARTDPTAAAARMATLSPHEADGRVGAQLASVWAGQDPEAALKWAQSLKGDMRSDATSAVYRALALDDPESAWKRLQGEPGHLRGKIIGTVLATVADEDPQKAAGMLGSVDSKSAKRIAAGELLEQFSWRDTRLGFQILDGLGDPAIRRDNLGNLMSYAAWNSTDVLREQLGKMSDREKIETASQVMNGLAETDMKTAGDYFLGLPATQRSAETLSELMGYYGARDPAKAFEFASALENPAEQTAAMTGLFSRWSREDPEAAASSWAKLPAGQNRLETLDRLVNSWSDTDPEAAKQWVEKLKGTERVRALASVLPALARDEPVAAGGQLAALIANPPDGMEKNLASSADTLAGKWAVEDPAQAARWAASLPDGQSRDAGFAAVSREWCQYDAAATAQWLSTMEAGSARDKAIEPLVMQVRESDPQTAFSWAASISDENNRLDQLRETLSRWRTSDLKGARAAFDAANLSDKERESLAKELQ